MYTKDEGDRRTILAALDYHGESNTLGAGPAKALADEMRREPREGFHLSIELGNAGMLTTDDVTDAMSEVIERLGDYGPTTEGSVTDVNGQTVGAFSLVLPEPPAEFIKACEIDAGRWVKVGDESDFQRLEMDPAPMPGGRVELILEPHSEGFLVDAAEQLPVRIEDEN